MSDPKTVLIVEDEMLIALHIESTITELGHKVVTATTSSEATGLIVAGIVDLAIVDYQVTDGNTEALMLHLQGAGIPFIICSGISDLQVRGQPLVDRPYLTKPFSSDSLLEAVTAAMGNKQNPDEPH